MVPAEQSMRNSVSKEDRQGLVKKKHNDPISQQPTEQNQAKESEQPNPYRAGDGCEHDPNNGYACEESETGTMLVIELLDTVPLLFL